MSRNRKDQIAAALKQNGLDALVCALPKNVLMLSGYWPVVGTSVAVARANGDVYLIVPEDEKDFAAGCRVANIQTFKPGSLERLITASEAVVPVLSHVLKQCVSTGARIGYEHGEDSEPSSYSAMHLYLGAISDVIGRALPSAKNVAADRVLRQLVSIKSEEEQAGIETACKIAARGFYIARHALRPATPEVEAAAEIELYFAAALKDFPRVQRAEAFVYVMSGKNSFQAHGAFAHSTTKQLQRGDLVLVHCNSFADGFSTDITRTFCFGEVDAKRSEMYDAIFAARQAAFDTLAPGAKASEVDAAARDVLKSRGFGSNFLHSTGHGVGFGAISASAVPRIHPKSNDVLQPGMTFNIEPAIYIEGYGGIRHCDIVAITDDGFKLLTDFETRMEDLVIANNRATAAASQ